jgi:predicted enzyme related to lactoylglutathione lyase
MSDFHGRFIWYELITSDIAAAKAFYGEVVGWTSQAMPMPEGDYTIFQADGQGVGGVMDFPPEVKAQGVPPNWTSYVAVDDADAAAEKVKALGGSVLRAPDDIPGIGRFAIVADPQGAVIAIMTPLPMDPPRPRTAPNTPGHTSWHELYAGDPASVFPFYAGLFGWREDGAMDMGPMGKYHLFANQDGQVGGMMTKPAEIPAAAWLYYFQVTDIDAAKQRVEAAGGKVLNGPMEVPGGGWIVQAQDPQGATFAVVGTKAA